MRTLQSILSDKEGRLCTYVRLFLIRSIMGQHSRMIKHWRKCQKGKCNASAEQVADNCHLLVCILCEIQRGTGHYGLIITNVIARRKIGASARLTSACTTAALTGCP